MFSSNPLAEANGNKEKKKNPEIKSCRGEYLLPSVSTDGSNATYNRQALATVFKILIKNIKSMS
jgi:hypothetical protein